MPRPLEGIRVLDWTIWQQGPVSTAILGDLGADVIKIEERSGGDPGRGLLRLAGLQVSDRPDFYFGANNRNKRGITLDLKKPEGREVLLRLAEKSDVFVQNFRRGVADRLGIGYADLRARNPRIVYASANGYGPEGEDAQPVERKGLHTGFRAISCFAMMMRCISLVPSPMHISGASR